LSERDARSYLAWSGALTRTLKSLGLGAAAAEKGPSLAEILAAHAAAKPDEAEEEAESGPAVPVSAACSGAKAVPAHGMPRDAEMAIPGASAGLGDGEKAEP